MVTARGLPGACAQPHLQKASFCLPTQIIAVAVQRSTGFRYEFWAAILDEIAGLIYYAFKDSNDLADASFAIYEFRNRRAVWRFILDRLGSATRPCCCSLVSSGCHV